MSFGSEDLLVINWQSPAAVVTVVSPTAETHGWDSNSSRR